MPDEKDLTAELENLKNQLSAMQEERDALKAAAGEAPPDLEGLKTNRDSILHEKKQLEKKYRDLEKKLEAHEKEKDQSQKKALEDQQKYKELWELEKQAAETIKAQMTESKKQSNFKDSLIAAGLNPKYVKYATAEIDQIQFDENLRPVNASAFIETYKTEYPTFFNSQESAPQPKPITDSAQPSLTGTKQQPVSIQWINAQKNNIPNMTAEQYKEFMQKVDAAVAAGQVK